eukprot:CAMPEP_0181487820 /NCGR_PEP_ID=MMETSP1110-20121109/48030_1 /TAXON_ID=174948 /ORGANISM="Symbiodinium sp., Strain CCMP421" /LENGTH=31 /DNA_ID= /DNA_START= /DNA_END= /DNA_ORIENTATION=
MPATPGRRCSAKHSAGRLSESTRAEARPRRS